MKSLQALWLTSFHDLPVFLISSSIVLRHVLLGLPLLLYPWGFQTNAIFSIVPVAFTPRIYSWYLFLLEAELTPGSQRGRKDCDLQLSSWPHDLPVFLSSSYIVLRHLFLGLPLLLYPRGFQTNAVFSITAATFTPRIYPWYSFLLEARSTPGL
jgi:hypothetical protein